MYCKVAKALAWWICVLIPVFAFLNFRVATAADGASGKKLYIERGCVACHGDQKGSKLNEYPALVGRNADFVASELNKYRNGIRKDPTMNAMAAGLSDKDIEDIAAYIGGMRR